MGLLITGALTVVYNGKNWLEINRQSPAGSQETPLVAGDFSQGTADGP